MHKQIIFLIRVFRRMIMNLKKVQGQGPGSELEK